MSVILEHVPFYREMFSAPKFFQSPFLTIGLPYIEGDALPEDFGFGNFKELLLSRGVKQVYSVDLYDKNADFNWDLNRPVPSKYKNFFKTVVDIGTVEHIFDTGSCLKNYFDLVKTGGLLALVTPVNGYFGHGLHVFNPELLESALTLNGFKILYKKFSTSTGIEINNPDISRNILIWLVAKKIRSEEVFIVPQQGYWQKEYVIGSTHYLSHKPDTGFLAGAKVKLKAFKRQLVNQLPMRVRMFWLERIK